MDEQQRSAEGSRIKSARLARGWTQKELASAADVAPNTVGAIEKGVMTQPGKLAAVRRALDLTPLAVVQEEKGYPMDIQIVRDAIGMWMLGVEESRRPEYVSRILRAITTPNDDIG